MHVDKARFPVVRVSNKNIFGWDAAAAAEQGFAVFVRGRNGDHDQMSTRKDRLALLVFTYLLDAWYSVDRSSIWTDS